MRGFFGIVVLALAAMTLLTSSAVAHAEEPRTLLISEVLYDPFGDDGVGEWLELYNPTDDPVNLSGYSLHSNNDSKYFGFPEDILINPLDYLVIAKDADAFTEAYGFLPDLVGLNITLANTADYVSLHDSSSDPVDIVVWGSIEYPGHISSSLTESGRSIERFPIDVDTNDCLLDFRAMSKPTPKSKFEEKEYSNLVKINELLPSVLPGKTEFIELYNYSDEQVDLSGWTIDDTTDGGSQPYVLPEGTKINAKWYLAIYQSESGIYLNDSGDSVNLIDPNGTIGDRIEYQSSIKGYSYAKSSDHFLWTSLPTPASQNIVVTEEEFGGENSDYRPITIREALLLSAGDVFTLSGYVTVMPDILSKNVIYIQDGAYGIQVYSSKGFPEFAMNQKLMINGIRSSSNEEPRVRVASVSDITVLDELMRIEPQEVKLEEIGEQLQGELIKTVGRYVKSVSGGFVIKDDDRETKVLIRERTGIVKPKLKAGYKVEVVGIVSRYKTEFRILPTSQKDVRILSQAELPKAGLSTFVYLLSLIPFLWSIYHTMRAKQEK